MHRTKASLVKGRWILPQAKDGGIVVCCVNPPVSFAASALPPLCHLR